MVLGGPLCKACRRAGDSLFAGCPLYVAPLPAKNAVAEDRPVVHKPHAQRGVRFLAVLLHAANAIKILPHGSVELWHFLAKKVVKEFLVADAERVQSGDE